MAFSTLLAVLAFGLIAWNVSGEKRRPLAVVLGLGLIVTVLTLRLSTGASITETSTGLFTDVGVGFIVSALILLIKKAAALPFMALGVLALLVAALIHLIGRFFGFVEPDYTSFLLELGPDDRIEEVVPLLEAHHATYERAFPYVTLETDEDLAQVYLIEGDKSLFDELMDLLKKDVENVDYVGGNYQIGLVPLVDFGTPTYNATTAFQANDPMISSQWGMNAIHAHEAHEILKEAAPVKKARVAILDTGVDAKHEDLLDVFDNSPGKTDKHGHGTHCAGIAGGMTNNGVGMASLNWNGAYVEVAGYHALGPDGMGSILRISDAILRAANDGSDVISMSLGDYGPVPPKAIVDAIDYAQKKGVIVVASAGNSNQDAAHHMPSNIEGVIAVAAIDQQMKKARFSNTVGTLARPIAAPGVDILSLKPGKKYVSMSGTSMSTPFVTGLLGVMRALNPDLSGSEAYDILHETGTTVNDSGRIGRVINAEAAIQRVLGPAQ